MKMLLPIAFVIGFVIWIMQVAGEDDSRTLIAVKAIIMAILVGCLTSVVASVVLRSFFGSLFGLYAAYRTFNYILNQAH
jgi:hypothetical protein